MLRNQDPGRPHALHRLARLRRRDAEGTRPHRHDDLRIRRCDEHAPQAHHGRHGRHDTRAGSCGEGPLQPARHRGDFGISSPLHRDGGGYRHPHRRHAGADGADQIRAAAQMSRLRGACRERGGDGGKTGIFLPETGKMDIRYRADAEFSGAE